MKPEGCTRRFLGVVEQLTALDATFLELEEADQSAHMHIGGVIRMDPQPGGGAPPIDLLRDDVAARLPDLPRFGQRLSEPTTGGLHWPSWEPDPDFDVSRHVFRAGLPSPGGKAELLEWAGEYYSVRLDRSRPLWELVIIELADGSWALVTKTHHSMVDGVGSVDIGKTLLDTQPDHNPLPPPTAIAGEPTHHDETRPPSLASRLSEPPRRLARTGISAGRAALRLAESAAGIATHPERAVDALRRSRALAELIIRDELIAAPQTSLNDPIGVKRRLVVMEASLQSLRGIKGALGGTVNDVVLAAAAGGFRRLLLHRGEELPPDGLRAMVPMNVRDAAERLALGNRISSLFIHLPVDEPDPRRRYERQIVEAEGLKGGSQALGSTTLLDLTGHMPPVLHSFVARSLFATRLFNVTITNVPGPQTPLYCFGSRVREIWPLVPIAAEHAVGLAVFSYDGTLHFCLNVDRDSCPDVEVLADGIATSLDELSELAERPVVG